jgi:uncharacterized protein (DUF488 family)
MNAPAIYTVGHSSLDEDDLLRLLSAHGIQAVADVRSIPASGRHPWFNRRRLEPFLEVAGIRYLWLGKELGGLREGTTYEEHMLTDQFSVGLEVLECMARVRPTAILCAERQYTDCHRRHIADALVRKGWRVIHIVSKDRSEEHPLQESLF